MQLLIVAKEVHRSVAYSLPPHRFPVDDTRLPEADRLLPGAAGQSVSVTTPR
jgi:hypothetical protein